MRSAKSTNFPFAFPGNIELPTETNNVDEFVRCSQAFVLRESTCSECCPRRVSEGSTAYEPQELGIPATPLIRLPQRILPSANVQVLQRWEGIVTETGDNSLWAELKNHSEPDYSLEMVELPREEIHVDDRPLIRSGACFYLCMGIKTSHRGVITRVSEIRFQRLPKWTQRKIAAEKQEAEKAFGNFWLAESSPAE